MECDKRKVGIYVHRLDCRIKQKLDMRRQRDGNAEVSHMVDWIVRFLYENQDKVIYQRDVEKNFSIGRSTVTGLLQSMEKDGLILRRSVEGDARLKAVDLTQKGKDFHRNIVESLDEFNQDLISGIEKEELDAFFQTMDKLLANAEQMK